ncbi:MAG: sensor histidine kinase [Microcella sp.]
MAALTPPRWSVRSRILGVILVITALGMSVAGASAYLLQRERVLDVIDEELFTAVESARAIATGLPREAAENDDSDAPVSPDPVSAPTSVEDAMVRIMQGIIPGRSESSVAIIDGGPVYIPPVDVDFQMFDDRDFMERVWSEARGGVVSIGTAFTEDGAIRYIAAPVTIADDEAIGVYVTGYQIQGELDDIDSAFTTYTIIAGITLIAIGVVGWFVAGRLLRPIRDVTAAASRITGTDLSERIPVTGRDDVSRLTETINGMFERLDESATAQRQLLDDVRHELKTPITIVRGHLELLDPRSPDEVDATRALAIDELDRMSELVSDIDVLAQASMATMLTEPTDVADLTQQVFAKARAIAGHEWRLDGVAEAVAPLAPSRITQAWLQLADNAAKYSPEGTAIRIGSSLYDNAVEMWVADEGPGIPEDAQKRIFERFGRADTGRGIAGSGLGLPIVAAIARGHGGYVSLDSSRSGSRFGIVVPLPASSSAPPPAAGSLEEGDEHPVQKTSDEGQR